ncbi:MAG: hypothetical protein IT289_05690 [Oligoflexia bacterium]|nr:hypothetical protein [Oligoflexia bacterium]
MGAKKEKLAEERHQFEVHGTERDLGVLQYSVLEMVSLSKYDDAARILAEYRKSKSKYPTYEIKTGRLFDHCGELIEAIRAKKTFPNLQNLAQTKQEEIHQKAKENWEDLRVSLRRLRTMENEMAVADSRSSVWVIRALIFSAFMILGTFVIQEAFRSFGMSFSFFIDEIIRVFWGLLGS